METFKNLYISHLDNLKEEISLYKDEENIWRISGDIKNTPGNLCLHICGNLNHFLGSTLGKTGYVRDRDLEFSRTNVPREELIKEIDNTKSMIIRIMDNMKVDDLKSIFPVTSMGENITIEHVFFKLLSHLNYHLGQINYHRRILDS